MNLHPLFADIDWNQVLLWGLIGGAIGAVIGLVQYLLKKNKKKE